MLKETVNLIAGRFKVKCRLEYTGDRIYFFTPYNKKLIDEFRNMEGSKWHGFEDPPILAWSVSDSLRNRFQLEFLKGDNPFKIYDIPLVDFSSSRSLYQHQIDMVRHGLTRKFCIFACEMGTGKTLAAIEIMEKIPNLRDNEAWYVGPKSGVVAVERELRKWDSRVHPLMFTYEKLVRTLEMWTRGDAPRIVIFDESSQIKSPQAQRSQVALRLANCVRIEHGHNGYVILMSGTPAPKSPIDWWHQAEVACPGFLREGDIHKFKKRLSIIENRQNITGGMYPHLVTWLDNEEKCAKCGKFADESPFHKYSKLNPPTTRKLVNEDEVRAGLIQFDLDYDTAVERFGKWETIPDARYHEYVHSKDEVAHLAKRLDGLVLIKFKKDCLDLPEKQYQIIQIKPTPDLLRTAKTIAKTATRTIEALTQLRELSDGFLYQDVEIGREQCPNCGGLGKVKEPIADPDVVDNFKLPDKYVIEERECHLCSGSGNVAKTERQAYEIGTPKDDAFSQMLQDHDDIGRFIVWGGFQGTLDRLVRIAHQQGWATLRVDGRGYIGENYDGEPLDSDMLLDAMDASHKRFRDLLTEIPNLCFIGHPEAGGMALTLTGSPTELFYSNSFKGGARMQAEDRFHRPGMDINRGATVVDFIMLKSDRVVLDNLKRKRELQLITMGELRDAFKEQEVEVITE